MNQNTCVICRKIQSGLYTLPISFDDEEKYEVHVCGMCWDVIATIAIRAVEKNKEKQDGRK